MEVTLGTKYQVVIPKQVRKQIKNLKPGQKLRVYPVSGDSVIIKVSNKSWVGENRGSLKGVWGDNPSAEIQKMRDEWDN